jgi:hypothetical protein
MRDSPGSRRSVWRRGFDAITLESRDAAQTRYGEFKVLVAGEVKDDCRSAVSAPDQNTGI